MARGVAYLRCSTEDQRESPGVQRAAIEGWAGRTGAEVVGWYEDLGVSGAAGVEDRPGLADALAALPRGGFLVVAKRDRLARDVMQAALIESLVRRRRGVVVSADGAGNGTGPEAELMRGMLDLFAAYERALIRSRTRAALRRKRSRGLAASNNPPMGWRKVGARLVEDAAEQALLAEAVRLREAGLSWRKVEAALDAAGYRNRAGSAYKWQKVWHALRRAEECPVGGGS